MRADDIFFPAMALLILAVVIIGFAQSYFLPGMVFAKLPNVLVHIHGALFVSWIFRLLIQTSLVAAHKVKLHMTLGILGVVLLPLMVVFGVLTLFDSIRRNGTGIPAELILVGDLEEVALFAGLTCWALLARRDAASPKRLMILGTMAIMGPAINRWPFPPDLRMPGTMDVYVALPLLVIAYDLWSLRRVHRSTTIASVVIIVAMLTMLPIASMRLWHPLVDWIRHSGHLDQSPATASSLLTDPGETP
jgi:hypothetical protein